MMRFIAPRPLAGPTPCREAGKNANVKMSIFTHARARNRNRKVEHEHDYEQKMAKKCP
jgi:hypothetical protein